MIMHAESGTDRTSTGSAAAPVWHIMLVEDNQADIRLSTEMLQESGIKHRLYVARDGEQAIAMIRRQGEYAHVPEPDLVLLDLNLPRKDGREVLAEVKKDPALAHIPVVILSTSHAERDVMACYRLHANCYLQKPVGLDAFAELVRSLEDFWFKKASLPPKRLAGTHDD